MSGIHINVSKVKILERLQDVNFPATKQDLIDCAIKRAENNPDDVVDAIESLPDQSFESEEELGREIDRYQE